MSVKVMAEVWELDLPATEKLVLLAMADHAHDDGTHVYPTVFKICAKTSLSERAVRGILGRLRDRGLLVVQKKATRYTPTIYRIPVRGADVAGLDLPRGADGADSGVHVLHPESSGEPSVSALDALRELNIEEARALRRRLSA